MGLAPTWPVMISALVLGAIGFAFAQPSSNVALAETVSLHRQATAFGLKQASLPVTTLLVGVTVPLFLGPDGWRWAFGSSAALTVLFIAVVLVGARTPRREDRARSFRMLRRRGIEPTVRAPRHRPQPPLLVLAAGAGLGSAATSSIGGFLVVFGVSTGLSPAAAGRLLAIGSIVCLASRLITGWVADRRGRGHLRVVGLMMLGGSTGFLLLAAEQPWTVVAGTALAFGLGWAWNGLFAFAVVHNHREYPAMATGVVQTAIGTGSATGPLAFGVTLSLTSYPVAWIGVAVALALGALLVLRGRGMLARAAAG
jgi:MFS family permease